MNYKLKNTLIVIALSCLACFVQANENVTQGNTMTQMNSTQQKNVKKISGTIIDEMGEPIIGATIVVTGNKSVGTIADIEGNFSLEIEEGASLLVSYMGYVSQTISTKGQTTLTIKLKEDTKQLDEVIVIGYTSQKKGLLSGSVSSMKMSEDMTDLAATSAGDLMVGRMAGVNVSAHSGIPGSQPTISIRTNSTFGKIGDKNKVQEALFVIDGVIRGSGDFNNLSPQEIDDIVILKDAASAAIYGAKSAGGVVLVTTKRGKVGKPVFNYSYSFAVDSRTKNMDLTSAVETGSWYNKINGTGDPAGWRWSQEELDHYQNVNGGWGYDQLDEVWRNPNTQTHNFSVNGGSEKVKYFSSLSYLDQKGFLDSQSYKKVNFRLNLTVDITDDLQFFAGMGLTDNNTSEVPFEDGNRLYNKLLIWQPDQPVYTDSGLPAEYGWIANVGAEVTGIGGYKKQNYVKPQVNFSLKYKLPLQGLSAKAAFSSNWANTRKVEFNKGYDMVSLQKSGTYGRIVDTSDNGILGLTHSNKGKDYLRKEAIWGYDYQLNFQLDYNRTFADVHKVQGALVYERMGASGSDVYGRRQGFPVYLTDQFWAADRSSANTTGGGGAEWKNGQVSVIGQFNYSYADKYLVAFSFREDGSMKFPKNQRWGFFPAGSLGWVVSEENFFNKSVVDHLKLRASAGLTGDDQIGGWQWEQTYSATDKYAYFGMTPERYASITYGKLVNPNLTWEKSLSYNIGADIHFFDNWNATLDYWYKDTYDILGPREATVPTSYPRALPDENYGKMRAQGIDIELGYRKKISDFEFRGNLTMSYGWNKILVQDHPERAKYTEIGQGKSSSYKTGYKVHSIIRTQDELDAFNKQYPNYKIGGTAPELGMLVYQDLSGPNGVPDGTIDSWDRVVLMDNNNPIYYGINLGGTWKGFSLDLMFNGRFGEKKNFKGVADRVEWNRGWKEWYDNEWSPENTSGWMPKRISANNSKTYTEDSDFWWKKADFLRLKYVTLSYSVPRSALGNVCDNLRVFVTGTNLFCLNNFGYWDPEIGEGHDYPIMRTFNFGASVSF